MVDFESSSTIMAVSATSIEECSPLPSQPIKKKRNLPGMPDPDAEVMALSPTTLLATNRFVCEICSKGFQRDQNLQLHRRGHNLPWKLKQRDGKEIRKRVYVCPEKSCIHHDPSRALGDLTGIKKHFSRKHGEKKWKCERCSKKYAVQSDWKAHIKTCGSKEYRCDCGTLFSRRDSFITHRAFCDALAQESARSQPQLQPQMQPENVEITSTNFDQKDEIIGPPVRCNSPPQPLTPSTGVLSPVQSVHSSDLAEKAIGVLHQTGVEVEAAETTATTTVSGGSTTSGNNNSNSNNNNKNTGVFASIFASSPASYSNVICGIDGGNTNTNMEPMSLSLSSSLYRSAPSGPPLFPSSQYVQQAPLSATALLQKAAQMGSTSSNTSFLHALGLAPPSPSTTHHYSQSNIVHWSNFQSKQERNDGSRIGDHLLMAPPPGPTTLDFLGLGMGGGTPRNGYSPFLSSASAGVSFGGVDSVHGSKDWDDSSGDRKPDLI